MANRHWNYRLVKRRTTEEFLGIHEVFYKDGLPWLCNPNPVSVYGHTQLELTKLLNDMAVAFMHPVLDYADFPPFDPVKATEEVAAAKEGN